MPAFVIADITLHDADRYREYVEHVPAIIAKHGGRYRVRGGDCAVLEGDWSPARLIVLEFPDRDAALAFYRDPAYAPYRALRQSISTSRLVLIDGFERRGAHHE